MVHYFENLLSKYHCDFREDISVKQYLNNIWENRLSSLGNGEELRHCWLIFQKHLVSLIRIPFSETSPLYESLQVAAIICYSQFFNIFRENRELNHETF